MDGGGVLLKYLTTNGKKNTQKNTLTSGVGVPFAPTASYCHHLFDAHQPIYLLCWGVVKQSFIHS